MRNSYTANELLEEYNKKAQKDKDEQARRRKVFDDYIERVEKIAKNNKRSTSQYAPR